MQRCFWRLGPCNWKAAAVSGDTQTRCRPEPLLGPTVPGPGWGLARALTGVQVSAQCACTDQCPDRTVSACARQMVASASRAASGIWVQLLPQSQQPLKAAPNQAGYSSPANGSTVRRRRRASRRYGHTAATSSSPLAMSAGPAASTGRPRGPGCGGPLPRAQPGRAPQGTALPTAAIFPSAALASGRSTGSLPVNYFR